MKAGILYELQTVQSELMGEFIDRVQNNEGVVKEENQADHLCAFFVPVHKESKSVYVGHHIKADEWMPPGGHIEKGEHPKDTVRREFEEELRFRLTDEQIELVDLTVIDIEPNERTCLRHWDMWYIVPVKEKMDYGVDKGEFYEAGWMSVEDAMEKMEVGRQNYMKAMKKVGKYL